MTIFIAVVLSWISGHLFGSDTTTLLMRWLYTNIKRRYSFNVYLNEKRKKGEREKKTLYLEV